MTANRSGWWVGALVFMIMVYILLNTLRTEGPGSLGPQVGSRIPPFAAPEVLSDLEGTANVATPGNLNDRVGNRPACSLRGPDIVNSCQLGHDDPLVLGFLFTRGAECEGSFDEIERLTARFPGVNFAGIFVSKDREEARELVRERGWRFPIGFDEDGRISTIYGIAVCPEIVLAYPGGEVRRTVVGDEAGELERQVRALVQRSRERGWDG